MVETLSLFLMNFFSNTLLFKRIIVFVSFVIVTLILWNTYTFFQKFKQAERGKMEIHGEAIKELNTESLAELDESISNLPLSIISKTKDIPFILVGDDGKIKGSNNLNPKKENDPKYLQAQLEIMKSQNQPIKVDYLGKTDYIYYRDSDLLRKLTYYPLALLLILILFLTIIYLFYKTNKASETNKLWTGMAKETAHQIGTPLSSLLGWISILKMEKADETYVKEIEKDVHRLNTIANRFSKIGSRPTLKKENVVMITRQAFDYLESRSSKQIKYSFFSANDKIFTDINAELFGWVIENLIKNAIDAMLGKGILSLSITEKGKFIEILVSDNGKGIPKKSYKQIFKPGFTTKKRGWGLGLSLSKRIVEDYLKGKISVKKSVINEGTTFQIILNKS
jgi:two-component system, sporulation sensor kinase D